MAKEVLFLSPKYRNPDGLLQMTLSYLKSVKPSERSAVVAGIYDQDSHLLFAATSIQVVEAGFKRWHHAEFEALTLAKEEGLNTDNALFVSSLSPCVNDSYTRGHVSCTNLLIGSGFKTEYVGRLDRGAAKKLSKYQEMGLTVDLTSDPKLLTVCDGLYEYFNRFKRHGRNKEQIIDDALSGLPRTIYIYHGHKPT